jgi:hypothetical protein
MTKFSPNFSFVRRGLTEVQAGLNPTRAAGWKMVSAAHAAAAALKVIAKNYPEARSYATEEAENLRAAIKAFEIKLKAAERT